MSYLISFLVFSFSFAGITDKCLENNRGMKAIIQPSLNRLIDSNSQRLDDLKWKDFCPCFAKVMESQTKENVNRSKEEATKNIKETDLKIQSCVHKSGFNATRPQENKPPLKLDPFFEEKIKFCGTNGVGRTIMIESELKAIHDPRENLVRSLSLPQYCRCYHTQLRSRVGDEKAKLIANFESHKVGQVQDMMILNDEDRKATEFCVGEQIPYPKSPEKNAFFEALMPEKKEKPTLTAFEQIYSSKFQIGIGLGPVVIGMSAKDLNQLMGKTGVKTTRQDFDEYRYGPNLTELKIRTEPPGEQGRVTYVSVNYLFNGPISHGIKRGELFESVIEKLKPWVPYSKDRQIGHLMFKEGAQFVFADYNKGTLEGLIAFDPSTHPLLKSKEK